ncbi:MAG: Phosphoglycerate mutase [uncultured Acidimicrobiales bacterium]|uniref:Phosphoglycerate mutase n=1 Tax=uncultured Acidimicrobiales bacterium TaxID=310071 RepID=A0A6J4I225_9ACTN|nr:MAG: Phosphoglycerate mutase [uncultured Acidimicrobiales bacterium]
MDEPRAYRQYRFRRPPGACEILLVRHGESAPAVEGQTVPMVEGHGDPPLDPVGERQAERVAERIAESGESIAAIYVTNLQRTQQTAAPLAARLGLEPRVERDLREVFLGEWEGGTLFRRNVTEQHPIAVRMFAEQRWDVIPGAEPTAQLAERVRGVITRIAAAHADETVVVVAHGGVIGQILADASGSRSFAFTGSDNAAISHIVVTPDRWIIRRYNDTAHLGAAFTEGPEPLT